MANVLATSVARDLESLFDGGSAAGLSDRQLLERFTARRDSAAEAAFATLVTRHGPMVLGICQQLLGDRQLAEDAFQAVFLVLARRARSIGNPDLLGNWLYGVALRTARKAKSRRNRQRQNEESLGITHPGPDSRSTVPADQMAMAREEAAALHDEINRLPGVFRSPIVLCYFEGLTIDEAARRLRCPAGTLRSRLVRARARLRRGLIRRGVIAPAGALAAAFRPRAAMAALSSSLCGLTTKVAIQFAAGQAAARSTAATALARGALKSMLLARLRLVAFGLFFLGACAAGAGFVAQVPVRPAEKADPLPNAARRDVANVEPAPGRMVVLGSVLDPSGKPLVGVPIDIVGRPREPWVNVKTDGERRLLLGRGATNSAGHFRLDASRTSSDGFFEVYALASVPGFGLGWAQLNADAGQPAAQIRLRPEQLIRGKVVDINGLPAAGVRLEIGSVGRPTEIGTFDGVNMGFYRPSEGLRAWPQAVTTDKDGRFTLSGIGRQLTVNFHIRDGRFAPQWIRAQTDDRAGAKEVTLALQPAAILTGRVIAADTGKPIAQSVVAGARADDQGRFTVNLSIGNRHRIETFPPAGAPYLACVEEMTWPKGAVKKAMDITLPRGVTIRGKVIETGTGIPLKDASVQYIPARNRGKLICGYQAVVASKDDGSYQIVVPPGKGHLFVYGPNSDHVLNVIGERMIYEGQPGGQRYYAHASIAYEVKDGDPPHDINASLRPGKTVKGRLIGPEGQKVEDAMIIGILHFNYFHLNWRGDLVRHARDGVFELHGLDPDQPARVSFLDAQHQWGTTVELSGKPAREAVTLRLQLCGTARARFVGPDGKPKEKIASFLELLGTPGPSARDMRPGSRSKLQADVVWLTNLDRKHYWNGPRSDADGRITLPALIPGATYRIGDQSTINDNERGTQIPRDFTVKPGETLDLGEIAIGK